MLDLDNVPYNWLASGGVASGARVAMALVALIGVVVWRLLL
jgi:hypothetical protein